MNATPLESARQMYDELAEKAGELQRLATEALGQRDDAIQDRAFLARNIATAAYLAERCFSATSDMEKLLAAGNLCAYVKQLAEHTKSMRVVLLRPVEDVADEAWAAGLAALKAVTP